jgi:hypothetical protein
LKYIPPEEFSPLVESLLPQQVLSIDPCFYFGNLNKVVISGPWPVEDDTAFVPTPVDTTTVSLPAYAKLIHTNKIIFYMQMCFLAVMRSPNIMVYLILGKRNIYMTLLFAKSL